MILRSNKYFKTSINIQNCVVFYVTYVISDISNQFALFQHKVLYILTQIYLIEYFICLSLSFLYEPVKNKKIHKI